MKRRWVLWLVVLCGIGFIPWPMTSPLQWLCRVATQDSGWQVSVGHARWIPWQDVELTDLKVRAPRGGQIHITQVRVGLVPWHLMRGVVGTQWKFAEIRMDPASWNIRQPLAKEVLSAGAVTNQGQALLSAQWGKVILTGLTLGGPMLRLHAVGWLTETKHIQLSLDGQLSRVLLEEMNLMRPENPKTRTWEPFTINLQGALASPEVSFASNFLTISLRTHGEKTL